MDQHPVPQNISSYEFRLVGDMTLKQFFQLAGGIGIGVLFWKLPLPFFLKYPLVGISILMGIMLAFVPVSGRPFSQWLMAFIKAIYSPTEYSWSPTMSQPMDAVPQVATPANNSPLDKIESQVIARVGQLFSSAAQPPLPTTPVAAPIAPISVESAPAPLPTATETTIHSVAPKPQPAPVAQMEPKRPIMVSEIVDTPPPPARIETVVPTVPTAQVAPITAAPTVTPVAAKPATFTDQMTVPPRPNMVAGLVVNSANQPIEGVILEISDSKNGIPVRALRSNKLGQFQTATQLSNGKYHLSAEKDGMAFEVIEVICEDKIIQPILVSANA